MGRCGRLCGESARTVLLLLLLPVLLGLLSAAAVHVAGADEDLVSADEERYALRCAAAAVASACVGQSKAS